MSGLVLTFVAFALVSLLVHELGHVAVGRALGYRCALRWRLLGPCAVIGTDLQPGAICGREALLCALGGPLASLLLLVVAVVAHSPLLVLVQLDMLVLASLLDYVHAFKAARHA